MPSDEPSEARPVHPEFDAEQAYLFFAHDCLEAMRRTVEQLLATDAGVNAAAREALQDMFATRLMDLESDRALCFGRIDRTDGDRYYIGRRHVRDEEGDPVVIDWRAPVAEAFYQANAADPFDLERRRSFRTDGARLVGFEDEVFAELAAARRRGVPAALVRAGDALMAEIGRERTGQMRDVIATIQAEQDRVIRLPDDGVLVVQGAPGTGKTAVGLHRAAFLLYRMREARTRGGVLVVGPNRAFMRYIERVLPSLGETAVVQSSVDALASIQVQAEDEPDVLRLKGDPRMTEVIARALRARTRPDAARREIRIRGRAVPLAGDAASRLIARAVRRSERSWTACGRRSPRASWSGTSWGAARSSPRPAPGSWTNVRSICWSAPGRDAPRRPAGHGATSPWSTRRSGGSPASPAPTPT